MEDLHSDLLTDYVLAYAGDYQFRFIAMINRTFYNLYSTKFPNKRTSKNIDNIRTLERLHILNTEIGYVGSVKKCTILKELAINLCAKFGTLGAAHSFHLYHSNIAPIDMTKVTARAALHGHLDGIYGLRSIGVSCPWDTFTCSNAALNGHFDILKYAHSHGCPWDAYTCANAALNGHLQILQYAHEHGCPWTKYTCSNAALNGHIEILEYARIHGCPWNEYTCSNAALGGHLNALEFAHSHGCPWNSYTCSNAAQNGHLHIIKYAKAHNCPWTYHTVHGAMQHGHMEVARWTSRHGCPGVSAELFGWGNDDDGDDDDDDDDEIDMLFRRRDMDAGDIHDYNDALREQEEVLAMAEGILDSIMRMQNPANIF